MLLLPQALPLRGEPASVRQAGGGRGDAARPEAEARRAAYFSVLARGVGGAGDHDQPALVLPARERVGGDAAQLRRQALGQRAAAGLEVDRGLLVVEPAGAGDVLDAVAEGADP